LVEVAPTGQVCVRTVTLQDQFRDRQVCSRGSKISPCRLVALFV
jgi:hypothetical protein